MTAPFLTLPDLGEDIFSACSCLTLRSPVDEALTIPGLLERIIVELNMRTIMTRAQLINQTWKEVVERSASIQQKLFFKPITAKTIGEVTQKRVKNPLLRQIFRPWFEERPDYRRESPFEFLSTDEYPRRRHQYQWITTKKDAFLRQGASWRRMLVQQPACPKLGLIQAHPTHFLSNTAFASAVLEYPEDENSAGGVRMGAMYDLVYRIMAHREHRCGMRVLWRQPETEPKELDEYYYVRGQHEVVIKDHYTDDIGIVILQKGKTPGLASRIGVGYRRRRGGLLIEDMSMWKRDPESFETQFRSEDFEEVEVEFDIKFGQDIAAGYGY